MKTILAGFLSLVTLAWALTPPAATDGGAALPWIVRQEALYLTGLWAFSLMSLAIVLATRPAWLERPLGGMDRIYRLHKWAGILAISFAALHWLVEMSDDVIKSVFGREGRLPKDHEGGMLEIMRDVGEDLGEWAIYALLAMLAVTLWKRFPYRPWRSLHHAMPVLYGMLAIHAAFLAPPSYWTTALGALLALFIAAGTHAGLHSLFGRIGHARLITGRVEALREQAAGVTEVRCHLDAWRGHKPGQFAFATFDHVEGAHPFTIASADRGDGRITFQIKGLGDYTRGLASRLHPGQPVRIEGPYGRFDYRRSRKAAQIWIAGGIGVTPFLAWLESLQETADAAPNADFYYCTRESVGDPFVARLEALCAALPSIRLHVIGTDRDGPLTALTLSERHGAQAEIWFCGPRGFATALRDGYRALGINGLRFHQEAFELR